VAGKRHTSLRETLFHADYGLIWRINVHVHWYNQENRLYFALKVDYYFSRPLQVLSARSGDALNASKPPAKTNL